MHLQAGRHERRRPPSWIWTRFDRVWLAAMTVVMWIQMRPLQAFPTASLSHCQTPTGWNCSDSEERDSVFQCDTDSCQYDGECLKIAETMTCVCDFKCSADYSPVCGSNNHRYQNECFLRREACQLQTEIHTASLGLCPTDAGSGSGDGGEGVSLPESSGEAGVGQRDSSCEMCQFGSECDEDAEDVWCVCNIDCSHINFNPVCASDGRSYDNPCQVKEASCQRQERIEVTHLGHCHGEGPRDLYIPCPSRYRNYCLHGDCQYPDNLGPPSCSCHAGFSGPQCEQKDYNVLFVVPGSGKIRYVLIASVIGALQITIITLVVLCVTRKSPGKKRKSVQKQSGALYDTDSTLRTATLHI
ncbi:tomoregulin-2-like [Oncorhynchus mykiss]|uniref:Tomoregulin-2-like n=1 Tax=Oncorhynchus mykiss TaxID=8022 RepID=A0A8K9XRJ7_ONCMY|nr:tomoregulin-2-like [Oncorhynchus mykiss]XP_036838170.1 tomoregulin-2-like [Oncorhynchus mykiss]